MPRKAKEDRVLPEPSNPRIVPREITQELKEAYISYAMSVITARALPDVRDGLKPVHRRILYTMHQMGLTAGAKFRKSAAVVGDVLGKYHPHGDAAVYDALVQLAQDFKTRYPFVLGQGNFGSLDGDSPAAMRYTEIKMSRIASELLRDLEKNTVGWRPNYDGTRKEPEVLPAAAPNLLLNGTLGIAVGMATNIPPHNLAEVIDATIHLLEHPDATHDELMEHIKGPDFPTGAVMYDFKAIKHAYATGRGGIVVRGEAEIVEDKRGQYQIIITSIPYRVVKADLMEKIAELVRNKKVEGIRELRDESTKDVRIVIGLKAGAQPQKILNALYKHTQLEDIFHLNFVALVEGVPRTLSLKEAIEHFIAHRKEVVRRRTEFDLARAKDREHILLGLKKALDHIDAIIQTIKKSKDTPTAHANLMKQFGFSERQATAILEMKLQKLAGLERKKIEDELKEVQATIRYLESILASAKKLQAVIKAELVDIKERYADERRTRLVRGSVKSFAPEDLIPEEEAVLVLTYGGYLKRTSPEEYRQQKRGGKGVIMDVNTKEEDFITHFVTASTHADILFFTTRGKVYRTKMYEIPEGKRTTKGKAIVNFLPLEDGERVTTILPLPKEAKGEDAYSLMLITRSGMAKRVNARDFHEVRRNGLIAMKLSGSDELVEAILVRPKDSVLVVSRQGQSVRFSAKDVREMGRAAGGVRAMTFKKGDEIVAAAAVPAEAAQSAHVLVVCENGFGKKTKVSEFRLQKRGGSGIKAAAISQKTGVVVDARLLAGQEEALVVVSRKGQVIRTSLAEIPSLSRVTQGVRIMRLNSNDAVAAVVCL